MSEVRFAILSFAHIHAWSYAKVLKELDKAKLVAIYDDSRERLRSAGETYGIKRLYDDHEDLLRNEEVDAVIITAENSKHLPLALSAIEAGKDLIVEKPIATTLEDADDMITKAGRKGVKLQTAFVMRYHDASKRLREIISSGSLGRVVAITSTNRGKYPGLWFADKRLSGGGAIMDHTVHVADLARWYTGDEFSGVFAHVARNIRGELKAEDAALVMCRMRGGTNMSIDCSWSCPDTYPNWGDVYMGVFCEGGYLVLDAFRPNVSLVHTGSPLVYNYYGPDADRNMVSDFMDVVRSDAEPAATGFDGRQALELALAAYESSQKGDVVRVLKD